MFTFFISVCLLSHPDEYKSKVVCEEERMRLSCKRGMQIAVYSAMFGRTQQGTMECPLHHRRAPSVGEAPTHFHCQPGRFITAKSSNQNGQKVHGGVLRNNL